VTPAELRAALRKVREFCREGHGDDLIAVTADAALGEPANPFVEKPPMYSLKLQPSEVTPLIWVFDEWISEGFTVGPRLPMVKRFRQQLEVFKEELE
jgi:hypothetical protein